jgi:hypothetical protein
VNWATSSIIATNIGITIKATDAIVPIANLTIIIETINTMIVLDAKQQGLKEQQVLQKEGWLQVQSHQEKEKQGYAQWPALFVKRGQFIHKKESFLLKISLALFFLVLLLLKQQELQQSPCGSGWLQAKRAPQARVCVFLASGYGWGTL